MKYQNLCLLVLLSASFACGQSSTPIEKVLTKGADIPMPGPAVRFDYQTFDPSSGRLSLYLSSHAGGIEGWPVPEARAFLRDLNEHATQRRFVYAHVWKPHDLVMWDNRATMHRARRYDNAEVRDMRRTTLTNQVSSLEQAP